MLTLRICEQFLCVIFFSEHLVSTDNFALSFIVISDLLLFTFDSAVFLLHSFDVVYFVEYKLKAAHLSSFLQKPYFYWYNAIQTCTSLKSTQKAYVPVKIVTRLWRNF